MVKTPWAARHSASSKIKIDNDKICVLIGPEGDFSEVEINSATNQNYKNFILELDFFQESDGNSGVFFRSSIEGTKISGWQVEVAPPGLHSGGIYESYGRGWLIKPSEKYDDIVKMMSWNKMKIKVLNENITTWINGKKMIQISDSKIGEANGSIALQIHDGGGIKVRWRNIRVKEID